MKYVAKELHVSPQRIVEVVFRGITIGKYNKNLLFGGAVLLIGKQYKGSIGILLDDYLALSKILLDYHTTIDNVVFASISEYFKEVKHGG